MSIADLPGADHLLCLLRQRLSDKTVAHCVQTADYLASFAEDAGIPPQQALITGLLHDLQKDQEGTTLLDAAKRYGISVTPFQEQYPRLLHGPVAAEECRRVLEITDPAVLDAIYWHTTGRAGWGNLGMALYFADYAEPSRTFPEAVEARRRLKTQGFRAALEYAVDTKLEYIRKRKAVDPVTLDFRQWLHANKDL